MPSAVGCYAAYDAMQKHNTVGGNRLKPWGEHARRMKRELEVLVGEQVVAEATPHTRYIQLPSGKTIEVTD